MLVSGIVIILVLVIGARDYRLGDYMPPMTFYKEPERSVDFLDAQKFQKGWGNKPTTYKVGPTL